VKNKNKKQATTNKQTNKQKQPSHTYPHYFCVDDHPTKITHKTNFFTQCLYEREQGCLPDNHSTFSCLLFVAHPFLHTLLGNVVFSSSLSHSLSLSLSLSLSKKKEKERGNVERGQKKNKTHFLKKDLIFFETE